MAVVSKEGFSGVKVDIPHEPGEWVQIRPLSYDEVEEARIAKMAKSASAYQGIDLESIDLSSFGIDAEAIAASVSQEHKQGLDLYDGATLLHHSVVAWSYQDHAPDGAMLDRRTAVWLLREYVLPMNGLDEEGEASANDSVKPSVSEGVGQPS